MSCNQNKLWKNNFDFVQMSSEACHKRPQDQVSIGDFVVEPAEGRREKSRDELQKKACNFFLNRDCIHGIFI